MSILKSFITVSGFTLISRMTGFVRDVLIAAHLGSSPLAQAFLVAFKLPNFLRRLFAEGAFNAAFVPQYAGKLAETGQEDAQAFASQIFTSLLVILLMVVLLAEMAMPWIMHLLAPGFADDPALFIQTTAFSHITFPYLLFISLVSLLGGILNGTGRFAAVAATPILLNVSLISFLLFASSHMASPAHALSWGVAAAGLIQFVWLFAVAIRHKVAPRIAMPRWSDDIKTFLRRFMPGVLGAGVVQINLWVDMIIATFFSGAVAYLYYAERVSQMPLSLIGTAMATAILPRLAMHIRKGELEQAIVSQNRALEAVMFLTIPATLGLIAVAFPLMSTLFERGEFTSHDTITTGYALMAYALGLPAFSMIKIFSAGHFAAGDTKTPVKIAAICLVINVTFNIGLVLLFDHLGFFPHVGLALATSISGWTNAMLLFTSLRNKGLIAIATPVLSRIMRMFIAGVAMALLCVALQWPLADWLQSSEEFTRAAALILLVASGAVCYGVFALVLRCITVGDIRNRLANKPR